MKNRNLKNAIQSSRTMKASQNVLSAAVTQALIILLNFAGRKIFLTILNVEYLGLNGLFSSILVFLSLAELGVGTAIIYNLYKPINDNDMEKIKSFMHLYRKAYICAGIVIIIIGFFIADNLSLFINRIPDIPHLRLIFMLIVMQTATTYFFSYKLIYLSAIQCNYIVQYFRIGAAIALVFIQILVLVITQNYYLYLALGVFIPFIKNVIATNYINRHYPFLKEKSQKLDRADVSSLKQDVFSVFMHRICDKISISIDSIILAKMMSLYHVGLYVNYHLIIECSDLLFNNILGTIIPSIGHFMLSKTKDEKIQLFDALQFMYYWLSTYLAVGLIVLFNPLIQLWLGKPYLLSDEVVLALVVSITLTNFHRPCFIIRNAGGLFWKGRFRPVAMSFINIIFSVFLVKMYGMIGVILGTALSKLMTFVWYDPFIVFKHVFQASLKRYFARYVLHWLVLAALAGLCSLLYHQSGVDGGTGFLLGILMITLIVNLSFYLMFRHTAEYHYLKARLTVIIQEKLPKK